MGHSSRLRDLLQCTQKGLMHLCQLQVCQIALGRVAAGKSPPLHPTYSDSATNKRPDLWVPTFRPRKMCAVRFVTKSQTCYPPLNHQVTLVHFSKPTTFYLNHLHYIKLFLFCFLNESCM